LSSMVLLGGNGSDVEKPGPHSGRCMRLNVPMFHG
jgi:hypothetical protein